MRNLVPEFSGALEDGSAKVSDKEVYSFRMDQAYILTLSTNHQEKVEWQSSNPDAAAVAEKSDNSCSIKGLKEGKVKITAAYKGGKYSCMVHVLPMAEPSELQRVITDKKALDGLK